MQKLETYPVEFSLGRQIKFMEASEPIYYPPPPPPSSFLEWNLLFNDPRDKFRDHSFLIKRNRDENFRNRGVLTLKKQTINLPFYKSK
jgi:hypothetical protein